jgi:hypothetical protein
MDLQEVGCGGMDWIELAELAGACKCGNEQMIQDNASQNTTITIM